MIYFIANDDIVNYIKQYGISVQPMHQFLCYFDIDNIDDEFLALLKLKFGDDIKTYKEICNDPELAYHYARYVIKEAFPEGEAAIATNANLAYYYARDIIKGRFSEGENAIAGSSVYSYQYAKHVLKGRCSEGEAAIASDTGYSYWYAIDVLHERFTLGEAAIKKDSYYINLYEKHFNITL